MQRRQLCFFLLRKFFPCQFLKKMKASQHAHPHFHDLWHCHSPVEYVPGSQDTALWRLFWNPFSCFSVEVTLRGKTKKLDRDKKWQSKKNKSLQQKTENFLSLHNLTGIETMKLCLNMVWKRQWQQLTPKKQSKTNEQSSHQENFDVTETLVSCALEADSGE